MSTSPTSDQTPPDASSQESATADEPAQDSDSGELAELRAELAQAQDRHRRALADLDNYRKRAERETQRRVSAARQAVLLDWLDALDSVERALRIEPGDPGLSAVLTQMEAILGREGVARIDAVGTRFDPERHEAVAVQSTAEVPDHTVLEVARSGFELSDGAVLRPAQVLVSRNENGEG